MKKSLLFAGLAAATLSFVGCNKETDVPDQVGRPVEIVLSQADTRTVNDGLHTLWVDGDQLSVFYAPAGTEEYSANTKFTITDAESNLATGTVNLAADSYDWYLLYAFASQIASPANTSAGYSYIGCRSDASQQQAGYDSKAHLAGCSASAGFPLYGIAKNVASGEKPVVTMKHVASALAVKVKNDTEAPITITKVEFTAPEVIVGSFYVNFAQDPVVLTPHATYTSKTAALTVNDAPELAAGATATFYLGIKPFTAASGSKLSLRITANEGSVEKEVTLSSAVKFAAGSIKTLNVGYANATALPAITVGDIKESITGTSAVNFEGTLSSAIVTFVSADKKYAFIQDAADGIVLFRNSGDITLQAGDALSGAISGAGSIYKNLKEITSLTVENVVSGSDIPEPLELTLAQLNAQYDKYVSYRVKVKGVTVPTAFSSRSTTMTDGEESLALRDQKSGLTITAGKYDIVGYASYFNSAQFGVWNQDDIIAVQTDEKLFGVSQEEFTVGSDVTSVQFTVTGNVDWTVTPGDGITSVDPEAGSGEATVTVTFPANTSSEEKEYALLVGTDDSGVSNSEYEIIITQGAFDVSNQEFTWDLTKASYESASADEVLWTHDAATMKAEKGSASTATNNYLGGSGSYTSSRFYKYSILTITPTDGVTIKKVEFTATSANYATTLQNSSWTNAAAAVDAADNTLVTVTPSSGTAAVSAVIGGTCGFTAVKVYYSGVPAAITLESITLSGQTTEYNVGDTFSFDGTVTAHYSNNSSKTVTPTSVSSPDMTSAGTRTVTVSYTEEGVTKEASYTVTVSAQFSLTFDFSAPSESTGTSGWASGQSCTYTLKGTDYSFALGAETYVATTYLMVKNGSYLGLPAISDKKLVQVTLTTSSGSSTSAKGSICSDNAGETPVSGGEAITLDARDADFSWTLTGTSANTSYYFVPSSKNSQMVKLVLVYE